MVFVVLTVELLLAIVRVVFLRVSIVPVVVVATFNNIFGNGLNNPFKNSNLSKFVVIFVNISSRKQTFYT